MAIANWWRGLLARVTMTYMIGALLLSAFVGITSYTTAQTRLLTEEESSARNLFVSNAREVRRNLASIPADATAKERSERYAQVIEDAQVSNGSIPLLISPTGQRHGTISASDLPAELTEGVVDNTLVEYRYRYAPEGQDSQAFYGIGVMWSELGGAQYYEIRSLSGLETTLFDLRRILLAATAAASLAAAGLGYYSARRALAPISRISTAAQAISAGDFKTRLDLQVDPDLAVLSRSFNEMVDALGARIERDERFTSDVSHELRSPLMTLTASLEVLERRIGTLPEVAQRAVRLLRQDLSRFERLVEDLLEISRMDAGAAQLQPSRFGLAEFLINVITQSRNPQIKLDHPERDRDLRLTADKRRLAQVITNLIDNANKYGGGATEITFRRIGDVVQITVEDEGPGVPPDDRKRIFNRFSRISSDAGRRASDSGVGLGLSLVEEHIRLHRGRVWVTDRIDGREGARFVIELPEGEEEDTEEEMAV